MNARTRPTLAILAMALLFSACKSHHDAKEDEQSMRVQYLEIVTPEVESTCAALAKMHGVSFGDPVAAFGNARTASLAGSGKIGVRAPMRESEAPVVRPYMLVEDIDAKVETAKAAGAVIALPPMEIPGQGKFAIFIHGGAIFIHGGIEHGLWQL